MTVVFTDNVKHNPPGKLADAYLLFTDDVLEGLKLEGFAVWSRLDGGRNVTFPARQFSVNGERRSYALLRPYDRLEAQIRLRDFILEAYQAHEAAKAEEAAS
jgi:hypothetical protein